MAPPVTREIVHDKPDNRTLWRHHVTPGWYIILSLDHYRCMQCYIPATDMVRIIDTLQYILKTLAFPKTIIQDYVQQIVGEIIAIIKYPRRHFLSCPMVIHQKN